MRKKEVYLIFVVLLVISMGFVVQGGEVVETKSILLKFSLTKGDSITKNISIYSQTGGEIDLSIEGIKNGVSLGESSFILDKGEEKEVEVFFDSNSVEEGIYVGSIKISGGGEEEIIPIIFEVESKDVFFDANLEIPTRYSEISPGDKIIVQLNVFDLLSGGGTQEGLGPSSVDVEYNVHDLYGNVLISENENFVVDTKVLITKTITFPDDIEIGQYVFSAVIKYKSSVGIATESFSISEKESKSLIDFDEGLSGFIIILIFIGFIFLVLILFFIFIIRDRDKLFLELKRYNTQELQRQKVLLTEQAYVVKKKKKGSDKEINKEIKEKIEKIKKKQKERIKNFKKLRDKGEISEMKRKLKEWKKKKYNTMAMEYKLKDLSVNEMNNIMNKWKNKYKVE